MTQLAVEHARACKEDLERLHQDWPVKKLNPEAAKLAAANLREWDDYYKTVKNLEKRIKKELEQKNRY